MGAKGRLTGLAELIMVSAFSLNQQFPGSRRFGRPVVQTACILNATADTLLPIRITSADAAHEPTVEFNALSSERYRKRMRTCLRRVRKIHRRIPGSGMDMGNEHGDA